MSESESKKSNFIRSKQDGCFLVQHSSAWGTFLRPTEDPEGEELTKEELTGIRLVDNFPRVPQAIWARIVRLFFHFCPSGKKARNQQLEASILFLRKEDDLSQWKAVVPQQLVTGVSVKADFSKNCDIVTGEEYTQFPPEGWIHAGSSHSHNTMAAYFSSTDDKNELGVPGLHIVVGSIDKQKMVYQHCASIVLQFQRKFVVITKVVDTAPKLLDFHPNVLNYIKEEVEDAKVIRIGGKVFPRNMPSRNPLLLGQMDLEIEDEQDDPIKLNKELEEFFRIYKHGGKGL